MHAILNKTMLSRMRIFPRFRMGILGKAPNSHGTMLSHESLGIGAATLLRRSHLRYSRRLPGSLSRQVGVLVCSGSHGLPTEVKGGLLGSGAAWHYSDIVWPLIIGDLRLRKTSGVTGEGRWPPQSALLKDLASRST
jgi:hypothetical protein